MKITKNINYVISGMTDVMGRQRKTRVFRKEVGITWRINEKELKRLSTMEGFRCYLEDIEEIEIDVNLNKYFLTFIGDDKEICLDYIRTDKQNDIRLTEDIADEIIQELVTKLEEVVK